MLFAIGGFEYEKCSAADQPRQSEEGTCPFQAMVSLLLWRFLFFVVRIWDNLQEVIGCVLLMKKTCYLNWRNLSESKKSNLKKIFFLIFDKSNFEGKYWNICNRH